jgi:hypothetical protein
MSGGIFLISSTADHAARWSRWILEWIERSGSDMEKSVYLCDSPDLARESLALPVREGEPPALVLIDRRTAGCTPDLARLVTDCIPEAWVVEILSDSDPLPPDESAFVLRESTGREEWESMLHHCLNESPSPQWSRTLET